MQDIIQILPDSVANQIAAGEVIQRPASAVKELLENSVDAGSDSIKLIIKDAGKTLLQVIDNGKGMSETDARMSFERHATSKIKTADDLFSIRTKGFRGEALASIAAIAHVELKTRREEDELGTQIIIEGTEVKSQEACTTPVGTSFSVKNLFFNVPARRNFLKSNAVETSHIIEEFQRVALAHPEITFSLHNNGNEIFHLEKGTFRQRIVGLFGSNYNERLVPVDEVTNIVNVTGFIGKPEFSRKTRGEQYFFINNRFIKNSYLNHAIQNAYEQLLPGDSFPSYFLYLEMDPKTIDINIHPTKTEIKFEDERSVYAIIRSTVKMSLGKYNIAPTLDFDQEASLTFHVKPPEGFIKAPTINVNPDFNPFKTDNNKKEVSGFKDYSAPGKTLNWEQLYQTHQSETTGFQKAQSSFEGSHSFEKETKQTIAIEPEIETQVMQLHKKYILSPIKSGFMVVDQQRAHERILFEKFYQNLNSEKGFSQQFLFPVTVEFSGNDAGLLSELQHDLHLIGFDIRSFGGNTFVIHGTPPGTENEDIKELLEKLLETFKNNFNELKEQNQLNLARSIAKSLSIKPGKVLSSSEMRNLIDELFACNDPYFAPNGKAIITTVPLEEIEKKLQK